ncbi:MAG: lipoate--protein ligase family protein [Planctomycetales bacterium]|nr:lipoate--protein ligase family protein [Planctomycetales bacterium]
MLGESAAFPARLLRHASAEGAWNMAVDEALMASAGASGVAVLRLYAWSEPTLSLGYFQRYADRDLHAASRSCALVRRMSGGGAILHDREATYSLVLPTTHPAAEQPASLYTLAHEIAIGLIGDSRAQLAPAPTASVAAEPFLCFQRRAAGDVLSGGQKVLGSAQRRRSGAILQHGSLLWEASVCAPELPGLINVQPELAAIDQSALMERWATAMARRLGFSLVESELSQEERKTVQRLRAEKYASDTWTRRR